MSAGRTMPGLHRRRGVTLSETLVTAAGMGVVLVVVAMGMEGIRTELKRDQAVALMNTLDEALAAYQQSSGQWPAVSVPAEVESSPRSSDASASSTAPDDSADPILRLMAQVPASRAVLETLPSVLRVHAQAQAGLMSDASDPTGWGAVQDPWGHHLRCLTAASPLATHRKAVAANRNRPIFISAGPDGHFGFTDVAGASDNIRSDENID